MRARFKKRAFRLLLFVLAGFVILQFIRPEIAHPPVTGDLQAPAEVKAILKRACYDCHSNETQLRWYDQIVPAYWRVAAHIRDGREGLNFSIWDSLSPAQQKGKLFESYNQVQAGAMPLKDYQLVHPAAAISGNDLAVLKNYVAGLLIAPKPADSTKITAAQKQYAQWKGGELLLNNVQPALNGIAYIPDYGNWQVVSTTDRVDNGTMRVIYGNDIAIKAIRENHINPWPNGTTFAKVAWDQLQDADGIVHTGEFKQVEFMIKDDKKYAATKGWGWARWVTPQLKPYGKTILFTTECINCHRPMSDNDYVFTTPVRSAQTKLKVINSSINRKQGTMSTLYGNPTGTVLTLATWKQQEDKHWFGANIPGHLQTVEVVKITAPSRITYKQYTGPALASSAHTDTLQDNARIKYILGQKPAVLP